MLRSDGGVVEARGDRVRQLDVAVLILEHEAAGALQHAGTAARKAGRVLARPDAVAASLDADQPRRRVGDEGVEDPHRVAAATHARDDGVGQRPNCSRHCARASLPITD